MEPTSKFIPFEELDPDAARRLPPGTRLRVSRRTFAEIATERARELRALSDGSSEAKSPANSKFVALEELDPEAARNLLPGVRLRVSRRTFAEVAAERFRDLQAGPGVTSDATRLSPLTAEQGRLLFAMAAAKWPPTPSD